MRLFLGNTFIESNTLRVCACHFLLFIYLFRSIPFPTSYLLVCSAFCHCIQVGLAFGIFRGWLLPLLLFGWVWKKPFCRTNWNLCVLKDKQASHWLSGTLLHHCANALNFKQNVHAGTICSCPNHTKNIGKYATNTVAELNDCANARILNADNAGEADGYIANDSK